MAIFKEQKIFRIKIQKTKDVKNYDQNRDGFLSSFG